MIRRIVLTMCSRMSGMGNSGVRTKFHFDGNFRRDSAHGSRPLRRTTARGRAVLGLSRTLHFFGRHAPGRSPGNMPPGCQQLNASVAAARSSEC
jgi:hypothetical protein